MQSLGVILNILLRGYQPFLEKNKIKLLKGIKKGDYQLHEEWRKSVLLGAKSFIESLITVDPSESFYAKDVLSNKQIRNIEKSKSKSSYFL